MTHRTRTPDDRLNAGIDEARHSKVKALHDVMAAVPCASLHSLAEAVLDAGYNKANASCTWARDDDTGAYLTECGSTWHLSDGGEPEEHGQFYCHHCGNRIIDDKPQD